MHYVSTRGGMERYSFTDILLRGLAPDGGLFVPETYPQVDADQLLHWSEVWRQDGYAALAAEVMSLFIDDIDYADLLAMCRRAYNEDVFSHPDIAPVSELSEGMWLLHLSNGPTAAFKDMAMQMLGQLFEYVLARQGCELNIVGATSGDTGSSAEYAMLGKSGVRVFMLTPAGRMSPFQQAQMFSIDHPDIINVAVDGVFDDCQDLVKALSVDAEFKERYCVGAVNSINFARLLAQVVYYVAAWIQVGQTGRRVSFSVPTGNFGDVCAGHVARSMGVPIDRLLVATNENDVLDEFFRTGVYRPRAAAQTVATSSPSMDISKASNFERFIFDLVGRDPQRVRKLFAEDLNREGCFDLSGTREFAAIRSAFGFLSGSSTHAHRLEAIAQVYQREGVVIDPHTADAWHVGAEALRAGAVEPELVVLETALPVKFSATIEEALGFVPPVPVRFAGIEQAQRRVVNLPNDVEALKGLIRQRVGA